MRLLQPMSTCPANQPVPRRLASRVGMPELSSASQAVLRVHRLDQEQAEGHDDITIAPLQSIELLTLRQGWKRRSQVAHRIAVEGAFTGKPRPLPKHCQRHHLATRQRGGWSGAVFLRKAVR